MKTQKRKLDHLHVCQNGDVEFARSNGFEKYELIHNALPETDLDKIETMTDFLGKEFSAPIFIEAMTGGTDKAKKINKNLAKAAQDLELGFGLGSQRAMIEKRSLTPTYYVRDVAPNIFIAGNIGAAQIQDYNTKQIAHAVKEIGANALAIHLNPAQEIAQLDGHDKWSGALASIKKLRSAVNVPIIVKEVGCGISGEVAAKLQAAGVDAIDVAGAGGTSWVKVDSIITGKPLDNFFEWGISTADSLVQCVGKVNIPVISSGGIRNGIDAAKSVALGASLAGLALPLLKPALQSSEKVKSVLAQIIMELKTSMFLVGAKNLAELRGKAVKI